ncbi:MAG TPA: beta-ketoacyl-[acyl-carrier-protein] synthase family protein [Solirubrobacteraceae bacterium]|nr:beta-ketoacyl-[acyl-carrier-protein] synthase family protein [Solirubrobacteraceae bacterium]
MSDPVVTGIGALTPLAHNAPDSWAGLVAGRSGITRIEGIDMDGVPVHVAGQIHGFDAEAHLGPKKFRRTARFSQLAIVAAREAVADAGFDPRAESETTGVVINSAVCGWPEIESNILRMRDQGPRELSPFLISTAIPNMPACEVAIDLGVHGPVNASALACASGTYALLEARRLIQTGEADVVICGGTDAGISRSMFATLALMGPLSESDAAPETVSRPFDLERTGFVFGEAAVVFVVESAEHAAARGARPYGTVAGGSLTSDAFHMAAPEPTGTYAARAISQALRNARLEPADLDYMCAHGTATRANDVAETKAIRMALGDAADGVPTSSPKSMVGHLIGAAGALSVMACLYSIRDGVLPPTINLETPDPDCDLDYVPNVAREATVRNAAANAFGFGGQNCVVVLRAID